MIAKARDDSAAQCDCCCGSAPTELTITLLPVTVSECGCAPAPLPIASWEIVIDGRPLCDFPPQLQFAIRTAIGNWVAANGAQSVQPGESA